MPCGEFYACPAANKPDKQCKNTCGAAEDCRAGKTDCAAGSVINLSQVVSTSCDVVNSLSQCGGRGSAQRTYGCTSTCNATAVSGASAVQGASPTVANVAWTVGANGVSQRLYVDEDLAEVNNGCPTANDCVVNATLAASANSYIVTGLLPSTTYYFRVVTYIILANIPHFRVSLNLHRLIHGVMKQCLRDNLSKFR